MTAAGVCPDLESTGALTARVKCKAGRRWPAPGTPETLSVVLTEQRGEQRLLEASGQPRSELR